MPAKNRPPLVGLGTKERFAVKGLEESMARD